MLAIPVIIYYCYLTKNSVPECDVITLDKHYEYKINTYRIARIVMNPPIYSFPSRSFMLQFRNITALCWLPVLLFSCNFQHVIKPATTIFSEPSKLETVADIDSENDDMDNSTDDSRGNECLQQTSGGALNSSLDKALELCHVAQDFWHKGDLDSALQTLDEAYAAIIEVDANDNIKLFQQKEDLRFLISKRILEIYASRHVVANGFSKAIPLTINQYVQDEIDRFTTTGKLRDFFIAAYRRSGRYRPYIIEQLKAAGLPESLSWLPLIESGYKTGALSKARALGLWQFIPSTGSKFGLNRDTYIDERLDPLKSTNAAIAYLRELHEIFGDWTTVLAAYNCGESRVLKIIRTQNVNYLDNFWDLYDRLPEETARYVPQFLATLHIVSNLEKYGMDQITPDPAMAFETAEISRPVSLEQMAALTDLKATELTRLNPELRQKVLPPDPYQLRVPPGKSELILSKINDIPITQAPPPSEYAYHKIQRGQTLFSIAMKYKISAKAIAQANSIDRRCALTPGKLLKIPGMGQDTFQELPVPTADHPHPTATTHMVRSGDSLWNMARRYNTTTQTIKEMNNLSSNGGITIGQTLKVPGKSSSAQKGKQSRVYQVRQGDTAFSIATKHKMPLAQFLSMNRMTANSKIFPGQELVVD